ncbi:winged helix DNA-binding domain-containing protein [Kitasatospora sp. NPDC096147]|uniref:winged helix DNA-binding domain-containing protein n=1 Tax=Kitasatospora sp. NPDC096147 TaxID=3364093 RepID=UPI0038074817
MTTEVLDARALNRATLARQLLLERAELTVPQVLERVVGLQAQTAHTWYVGLWSRLAADPAEEASALLADGSAVRIAAMRGTIHLLTTGDAALLRPLVDPVIERGTLTAFRRKLDGLDLAEVSAAGLAAFADGPLTFAELGRRLAERWPGHDGPAMAQWVRAAVPLAQVPPRGLWGRSGPVAHLPLEQWTGQGLRAAPVEELVRRYLAAFGPATVKDVQAWSGLTRLAEVVRRLRPELVVLRDEQGRELYDLPQAPRPDGDTPAPVRYLYEFENLLRGHADRSRVLTVDFADQGYSGVNDIPGAVLVDGLVAATWRVAAGREETVLTVRPFRRLTAAEQDEVVAEGEALLGFLEPGAARREVRLTAPVPG